MCKQQQQQRTFKEQKIPFDYSQINLTRPNYVLSKRKRPTNSAPAGCEEMPNTNNQFQVWLKPYTFSLERHKTSSLALSTSIILSIPVKASIPKTMIGLCLCWSEQSKLFLTSFYV